MSVFKLSAAAFVASLLAAVPALAVEDGQFTWTGYGRDGSSSCPTYQMTIDVKVENNRAIGQFQQKGRTMRNFDLPINEKGEFKGQTVVGGGEKMEVSGLIGNGGGILLDGYCKFGGRFAVAK